MPNPREKSKSILRAKKSKKHAKSVKSKEVKSRVENPAYKSVVSSIFKSGVKSGIRSLLKASTLSVMARTSKSSHSAIRQSKSVVKTVKSNCTVKSNKRKSKSKSKSRSKSRSNRNSSENTLSGKTIINSNVTNSPLVNQNNNQKIVIPTNISGRIKRIMMLPGPTVVKQESAMHGAGYMIEQVILGITEYSQVMRARFVPPGQKIDDENPPITMAVKMTNLAECSPRFRTNLLKNSVRIMRAIGRARSGNNTEDLVFPRIYEIFQMESVRLYIFMEECQPQPTMYDLVKMPDEIPMEDIRQYLKAICLGVDSLQKKGIAHRYLKLQHIIFDNNNRPKLCGWSKSVFFYDIETRCLMLQHAERRVRRNYYLPPEAFIKPYDPSKADIWAIGVLLITMCSKRYPFNVRDETTPFSGQWLDFKRKHELNEYVRQLCDGIFLDDPKKRNGCAKILESKFFRLPTAKLIPLSLFCDQDVFDHEMSRVGALSGIDFNLEQQKQEDFTGGITGEWNDQKAVEVDAKTQALVRKKNTKVGEEESGWNIEDSITESTKADFNAPEEAETMAIPELGQ